LENPFKNEFQINLLCIFAALPKPMNIRKHIPNLITLLNLLAGCIALVYVAANEFEYAFYFVCLGIFFDFFDGFFARMFKVSSPLGLQLDSLADMVTSGVVPGFVLFKMMNQPSAPFEGFAYLGFIITLGACYRLANFNIDTRQTDLFIGLPTPANALFFLSLPLILNGSESILVLELLTFPYFLLLLVLLSAYVMNANLPLFSLKVKSTGLKNNKLPIFFLVASLILLVWLQIAAIVLIILLYIFLSILFRKQIAKAL
jgi:CDP-diacylglycerol---serine O-phosphatidyltransferase